MFLKLIVYCPFLYIVFIVIHSANVQSGSLPYTQNIWYQDFYANSQVSRNQEIKTFARSEVPYYHYKNTLAYLNDTSAIEHIIRKESDVHFSPSREFYITYNKTGSNINFYEKTGRKKWGLQSLGYPHLSPQGGMAMLISTDNSSVTLFNQAREIILDQTYLGGFITAFSFSPYDDSLVIATIEGKVYYYKYLRKDFKSWEVPKSLYTYAKGIEISKTGQSVAVLSGLKPERLTLYDISHQPLQQGKLASERELGINERWSILTGSAQRKKNSMFIDEANDQMLDTRGENLIFSALQNGNVLKTLRLHDNVTTHGKTVHYTLFNSVPGLIITASALGDDIVVRIFSADDHELVWKYFYPEAVPLHVELQKQNDYTAIMLTTSTTVYRYRLFNF